MSAQSGSAAASSVIVRGYQPISRRGAGVTAAPSAAARSWLPRQTPRIGRSVPPGLLNEADFLRQEGVAFLLIHAHRPAHHDQSVRPGQVGRHGFTGKDLNGPNPDSGGIQGVADNAERFHGLML